MLKAFVSVCALLACASVAASAADVKHGEEVFGRCALCHSAEKGGGNGLGPNLYGIAGKKAAALKGFSYSPSLKSANITWTDDKLRAWLSNPQKLVPGTRMVFAGLKSSHDLDDVIAYLKSKK